MLNCLKVRVSSYILIYLERRVIFTSTFSISLDVYYSLDVKKMNMNDIKVNIIRPSILFCSLLCFLKLTAMEHLRIRIF